ncbi:MAG: hypothetical protein HZC18_08190 [Candidatus Omnitrophica bacterium]|nr:hypothetical protein [Candidatus Omnitrophota bacterium]
MTNFDEGNMWFQRTNQTWKIGIFLVLLFLSPIGFFVWISMENQNSALLLGTVSGIISIIWLTQSIKCPKCGYKPIWSIMKSAPASEWFIKITNLKECPSCNE